MRVAPFVKHGGPRDPPPLYFARADCMKQDLTKNSEDNAASQITHRSNLHEIARFFS